jgi:MarR family 2-MHQ and catechol resistance regulon transcriptional repressor
VVGFVGDIKSTMENARARVLVVDGDANVAKVMVRVLGRAHDISPLPSGEEALGRITAGERFDLILCDLALPRLTGMGFRERVGAIAPELVERIVVMTGGVSTPSADDALLDRCGVAHPRSRSSRSSCSGPRCATTSTGSALRRRPGAARPRRTPSGSPGAVVSGAAHAVERPALGREYLDVVYLDVKVIRRVTLRLGASAGVSPRARAMSKPRDSSGTRVWLVLMKAQRALGRHAAKSIGQFEIGLSDFAILEMLLHKGPLLVNEIGRRVELTSGAITSAVDRLEARGLVRREADDADRRARVIHLTAAGKACIQPIFAVHKQAMDAVASGLTAAERATLIELLKKLGTSAEDTAPGPEGIGARRGDKRKP